MRQFDSLLLYVWCRTLSQTPTSFDDCSGQSVDQTDIARTWASRHIYHVPSFLEHLTRPFLANPSRRSLFIFVSSNLFHPVEPDAISGDAANSHSGKTSNQFTRCARISSDKKMIHFYIHEPILELPISPVARRFVSYKEKKFHQKLYWQISLAKSLQFVKIYLSRNLFVKTVLKN